MPLSATGGIPAGSVVVAIPNATNVTISLATTAAVTTATFLGDAFKILLIKNAPTRTFDGSQSNVGAFPAAGTPASTNVGTDETTNTAGSAYATGGQSLSGTTLALLSTTTAVASFSNVSWTTATFSTTAGVIYNTGQRLGQASTTSLMTNRSVSVHDFSGNQAVSGGTLTLTMPSFDATNGLLRIA